MPLACETLKAATRKKRYHQKSFSGCQQCKRRRIKCDETKPRCRYCVKLGVDCLYIKPKTWVFDASTPSSRLHQDLTRPPRWLCDNYAGDGDARAFQYYEQRTVPWFAAYFGGNFWTCCVPQVAAREPAIRSGLLASSYLVESIESPLRRSNARLKFFEHYKEAVTSVESLASTTPRMEVLLSACVLFACLEFSQGSTVIGYSHVRSGAKLLQDRLQVLAAEGVRVSAEADYLCDNILPLITQLSKESIIYGTSMLTPPQASKAMSTGFDLPQIPSSFPNLLQANNAFNAIMHYVASLDPWLHPRDNWPSKRLAIEPIFSCWREAIADLERSTPAAQATKEYATFIILQCNIKLARAVLQAYDGIVFDNGTSKADALSLYSHYLDKLKSLGIGVRSFNDIPWTSQLDESHSGHFEILAPLLIIAISTNDPDVQDAALDMLRRVDRHEGTWTSKHATQYASIITSLKPHGEPPPSGDMFEGTTGPTIYTRLKLLPCLHVASFQWPLPRILPIMGPRETVDWVFNHCSCKPTPYAHGARPESTDRKFEQ